MNYKIVGDTIQSLYIELNKDCASVYSESGNVIYMTPNIRLLTSSPGKLSELLKRVIAGNSPMINHFELESGTRGEIAFSTRFPSKIIPLQLKDRGMLVQQHSFLCAEESVHLEAQSDRKGTGIFGEHTSSYNRLSGKGCAFIAVEGDLVTKELDYGESLLIHPGHLAAYEQSVQVEIQRQVAIKNMFLSEEGVYFLKVSGPGKVMLHTLNIHSFAEAVSANLP